MAARGNHAEALQVLLDAGADVESQQLKGFVAKAIMNVYSFEGTVALMFIAAEHGFVDSFRALVAEKKTVVWLQRHIKARARDRATLLWVAAKAGHDEVVRALLEHSDALNVDVDVVVEGTTPAFEAADNGHYAVLEMLLSDLNADFEKPRAHDGATLAYVAAEEGHLGMVVLLQSFNADMNRAKTNNGATPLMAAAHNGHHEVVKRLLLLRANMGLRTTASCMGAPQGSTALDIAKEHREKGMRACTGGCVG
jgi:ankyrin repeat protein